ELGRSADALLRGVGQGDREFAIAVQGPGKADTVVILDYTRRNDIEGDVLGIDRLVARADAEAPGHRGARLPLEAQLVHGHVVPAEAGAVAAAEALRAVAAHAAEQPRRRSADGIGILVEDPLDIERH